MPCHALIAHTALLRLSPLPAVGVLEWPFWTKLIVVAVGFAGGLIFMYIQCKVYLQLWRRLKAFNRIIFVQNCPDTARNGDNRPALVTQSNGKHEVVDVSGPQTQTNTSCPAPSGSVEVAPVWHWVWWAWLLPAPCHRWARVKKPGRVWSLRLFLEHFKVLTVRKI